LLPKVDAPILKNYVRPAMCPEPAKKVISIPVVAKLKKLALNHRGIPKPPDLGYNVPYPIPTMEEMQNKFNLEEDKRKTVLFEQKVAQKEFLALQVPLEKIAERRSSRGVSIKKIT